MKLHLAAILADNARIKNERDAMQDQLGRQIHAMNKLHKERLAVVSQEVQNLRAIPEMRNLLHFITEVDMELADAMLAEHDDNPFQAKNIIGKKLDIAENKLKEIRTYMEKGEPASWKQTGPIPITVPDSPPLPRGSIRKADIHPNGTPPNSTLSTKAHPTK